MFGLAFLLTGASATGPSVVATIPVGDAPRNVAVNVGTNRVYITDSGEAALSVVDGSTNEVVDELSFDLPPWDVALNPTTNRMYVSFSGMFDENFVKAIDLTTNEILTTVDVGSWPRDIAVNTATNRVYVINHTDGTMTVIDGATDQVVATVDAGFIAREAAVDEATNRIYVSTMDSVSVLDGATNQLVDSIALDKYPWGIALNPITDRIYLAHTFDDDNSVSVIDATSKAVVATVPVGTAPEELAVNPTTNHVIVSNGGSNDVTIIDGATNTVVATLPVGAYPTGVAVNPVTNLVYVANSNDETVSVISDPPSEATPAPTPTPPAGTTPFALGTGWNQVCYVGPEQPIENALTSVLGDVSAVYRLRPDQGYDRWFPGRPEVSTITTVSPYKPLLLLMADGAAWNQTPSGSPPASATLAQGWNSICYAGANKPPADATSAIADDFSILYMLASNQAWNRYAPSRPEVSNIEQLEQYDAVLMLATGGTTWAFGP